MVEMVCNHLDGKYGVTNKIRDALNNVRHEFIYIGFLLDEADRLEYYREGGFEDIYSYCESEFGFKRSSTNNFIRVYRCFGECMGLQANYAAYGYSQLTEMCSMTPQQLNQCKPGMTVTELRAIKKGDSVQTSGRKDLPAPAPAPVQTSGRTLNEGVIRVSVRQLSMLCLETSDACGVGDIIDILQPESFTDELEYFVSDNTGPGDAI